MAVLEQVNNNRVVREEYGDGLVPIPNTGSLKVVHTESGIVIVNLIHSHLVNLEEAFFFGPSGPTLLDVMMAHGVRGIKLYDMDEFLMGPLGVGYWYLSRQGLQGTAAASEFTL